MWVEVSVQRLANYLATVIDADCDAIHVPGERTEVLDTRLLGPQESMKVGVAGQVRLTNDLTLVIQV